SAIRTHLSASLPLPFSVQRAYDVLVFAHQIGLMPEKECDRFKKTLLQQSEFVPAPQRLKSFREGLAIFEPRLIDSTKPTVGIPPRREGPTRFSSPLLLSPTAGPTL